MSRLFSYPKERALEDAAFARGVTPTAIHALGLPVYPVLIEADIEDAEDYELIDRFLSRGIAEGGLATAADLARFFALEVELVDRALRTLQAIGHMRQQNGRWELTDLGARSVQDQRKYVLTRRDRRKLYFDAFGSRPLPRVCYDTRKVTYLSADAFPAGLQALASLRAFDGRALQALATSPERERLNLPERIDRPRQLDDVPVQLFLPLYLVRGADTRGRTRHLAYTQASGEADADLSDLIAGTSEVVSVVENEGRAARPAADGAHAWLGDRGFGDRASVRLCGGMVRASLPATAFGDDGIPLHKVGSFLLRGNGFFQLWCEETGIRQRALLGRADAIFGGRSRTDPARLRERVAQLGQQLGLDPLDLDQLQHLALDSNRKNLAAQVASARAAL